MNKQSDCMVKEMLQVLDKAVTEINEDIFDENAVPDGKRKIKIEIELLPQGKGSRRDIDYTVSYKVERAAKIGYIGQYGLEKTITGKILPGFVGGMDNQTSIEEEEDNV